MADYGRNDSEEYDPRRSSNSNSERGHGDRARDVEYGRPTGRRDRSRSRSPPSANGGGEGSAGKSKRDLEAERRARMARLRAENEAEERKLSEMEEQSKQDQEQSSSKEKSAKESIIKVKDEELEGLDEEEQMRMLLGFSGGFGSTKGEKVEDNHKSSARGAAAKNKARKYRQYMNRKGGFNRPLDKMN